MMNDSPRMPPYSIDAEQSVVGGILLSNLSYFTIAGFVSDDDFYRQDHPLIFRAMKDSEADNQPIDVVMVSEWMQGRFHYYHGEKRPFFDIIGGVATLANLNKDTPSSANDGIDHSNSLSSSKHNEAYLR
jgi:replicative DNA helicase